MGLIDSPYVGSVRQKRRLQPTFCMRVQLWRLRHTYVDSFLLDPDIVIGSSKYGGDQELY